MKVVSFFANILSYISKSMVRSSAASYGGYGIEEMPESMKKFR
jgi:hypothetical protein